MSEDGSYVEGEGEEGSKGGEGAEGGGRGRLALNASEVADVRELIVDLLLHSDIETARSQDEIAADLIESLGLVNAIEAANETAEVIEAVQVSATGAVTLPTVVSGDASAAATEGKVVTRAGCAAAIHEAVAEWRRQKGIQDATSAARAHLLAEIENEREALTTGAPSLGGSADAPAQAASPPIALSDLVARALAGYEVPATMSDNEVLIEYLQLLSLDSHSLTAASTIWVLDAIVDYRRTLAEAARVAKAAAEAANATAAADATRAAQAAPVNATLEAELALSRAAALRAERRRRVLLLTPIDRQAALPSLLASNETYPLARARSPSASSEDFALVMAAVLRAYGVHSRAAVLCSEPPLPPPRAVSAAAAEGNSTNGVAVEAGAVADASVGGAAAAAAAAVAVDADGAGEPVCRTPAALSSEACAAALTAAHAALRPSRKCRTVIEVRLGKSAKKLAGWVAQHRKAVRASGAKNIKGAKDLWYRKDSQGFVWLPLTYALAATEQVPGAPYPEDISFAVHYPIVALPEGATAPAPDGGALAGGVAGGEPALNACAANEESAWSIDGAPVDSCGRITSGRGEVGHVLSTM